MKLSAFFDGAPNDPRDKAAHAIFLERGGEFVGSGNSAIDGVRGDRDIQYEMPDDRVGETIDALKAAGFRFELYQPVAKNRLPWLPWPDPTAEMIESNGFGPIWDCIKEWDINVPDAYAGYCKATGNHVRAILDELHHRGFKIVPIS